MEMKEDNLINNNKWLYRNITGKKGLPLTKLKKVKDEIQQFENNKNIISTESKDYLEKRLRNVKLRQEYVDKLELKLTLEYFNTYDEIDSEVKNEMSRLIIKKYPEYSYLINTEKLRESRKNSGRKYSSISSTLRKKSIEVTPLTEEKTSIIKSMELNSINENTTDNQNSDDGNNESEDEEVSYQEKYSGFIDPNIEVITTKNKKNVIKKESKAVTKIIQVSNDLRKWTDENLSKKQIEPLDQYLGRSGHNIFEGKKSYRLSLPSITMAKDEDDPDNLNENESNNNDNQKNKKKKNKKDNEFDILLNACRLMVLDSKPPMPIHVTEEHNTPYEYLEKITNNLGVEISKVKQAKNKTKNKKKNNKNMKEKINSNSNTERFLYGNWYISPSKWNIMKERREQCRSVQMYPSSENWNKYIKFHKYLESPYNFENKCSDSQSDNE